MNSIFSDRIHDVPRSFIRDILRVAVSEDIISFAGGLPNRDIFPVEALKEATIEVFNKQGKSALQYAASEGYLPLREYLADWYKKVKNIHVDVNNILITSGSQQGLDLLGKIFINDHQGIILEEPGYLGAIQAFSMFRPAFYSVPLLNDGPDIQIINDFLKLYSPRLFYMVPNFQNPSGITYSYKKRVEIGEMVKAHNIYIIEDDPYGQLRYGGQDIPGMASFNSDQVIMLGTFSKTVVPSFRIGWVVAPDAIMEKLIIAKQAADLHSNSFSQMVLFDFLINHKPEKHIEKIKEVYGRQCRAMIEAISKYFPSDVKYTTPEGGMFLWVTLPDHISTLKLFDIAIEKNVAFVPGNPFYVNKDKTSTMRLNFSCVDEKTIDIGIRRLAEAIEEVMK